MLMYMFVKLVCSKLGAALVTPPSSMFAVVVSFLPCMKAIMILIHFQEFLNKRLDPKYVKYICMRIFLYACFYSLFPKFPVLQWLGFSNSSTRLIKKLFHSYSRL